MKLITAAAALAFVAAAAPAVAQTSSPAAYLQKLAAEARRADPAFASFSAARGRAFFARTHGAEWSCASCHTQAPTTAGRHAKTGKTIAPLAPAANAERFADAAKTAKWFKRNCNDVLGRACTPAEQGDVLAYLISLKP
jgi:hypothetical protein